MESVEKKLELIRMMRSEQEGNVERLQRREHVLYPNRKVSYLNLTEGRNEYLSEHYSGKEGVDCLSQEKKNYGFYMRLGICMGLFLLFVYMETQNISYFGITHTQIQETVGKTTDINSFAFMGQFPYTLEE